MTETAFDPSATIARMVPPGAHRVLDIDITSRCDVLKCSNCTRGLLYQKERVDMTPENFRLALQSAKDFATQPDALNGHRVIAMIGGNPVLHPKFDELCAIFREVIPNKAARGLWTNNIFDKGDVIRETFGFFNLNVHGDEEAAQKMRAELNWPNVFGSAPFRERSLHSSVFAAIRDFVGTSEIPDEAAMWAKIEQCDVNRNWSGSMVQIDGKLYGYFCEIAATFESIYGHKTGIYVETFPDWWKWKMRQVPALRPFESPGFEDQAREWCPKCGVSLKLKGHEDLDFTDDFSKTHAGLVQIAVKRKQKHVMHETLPSERAETATDYQRLTTPADMPTEPDPIDRLDLKGDCGDVKQSNISMIVADGELQKFSHPVIPAVLANWVKALKPGGILRISVPDFAKLAIAYAQGVRNPHMEHWLMGSHATPDNAHGAIFDTMGLRVLMMAAGLRRIRPWDCDKKSWIALEGMKPDHKKPERTIGLRSVPRVGWTDGFANCLQTSFALSMEIIEGRGVYFTKVLAMVGQELLDKKKYLLFIDYDSLFDPSAIMELYRLMEAHPEADAICGCQQRRQIGGPLISVRDAAGNLTAKVEPEAMRDDLFKVASAHFGLTLIRSSSLATFSKPWFKEDAGPDGDWKHDWCDADVAFWRKWEAEGKTLFQANYVPVGHLQLMATWPSWNGTTFFQHVEDWQQIGMPPEARR